MFNSKRKRNSHEKQSRQDIDMFAYVLYTKQSRHVDIFMFTYALYTKQSRHIDMGIDIDIIAYVLYTKSSLVT